VEENAHNTVDRVLPRDFILIPEHKSLAPA
jgi:hypothetical protein